jgi:hypothetical protein
MIRRRGKTRSLGRTFARVSVIREAESTVAAARVAALQVGASLFASGVVVVALVDILAGRSVHCLHVTVVAAEADDANLAIVAAPEGF